jgi:hypothetical protein
MEARRKHALRQREGHKTADWEGVPEMMREELILQEMKPMIGLSLSFCVRDIMDGKVAEGDVEKIITMTKCATDADWQKLIDAYRVVYWRDYERDAVAALLHRLWAQGKIEQPRLADPDHTHSLDDGYWMPTQATTECR